MITEALLLINKIYKTINKAERIKTVFLKTLIIDRECFNKLEKLILDGPKYLASNMRVLLLNLFLFLLMSQKNYSKWLFH